VPHGTLDLMVLKTLAAVAMVNRLLEPEVWS
jgi:hypothetical protein